MSDQEFWKKEAEWAKLDLFLEAYEAATGEVLTSLRSSERPDFICGRADGAAVGIELTRVMRDPESAFWDWILFKREYRDAGDTLDCIWATAYCKSQKLSNGKWHLPDNTILVLQVMDCPLSDLHPRLEDGNPPDDYADLGFAEVWVADYSEVDAYGAIEIFGLWPEQRWDYYKRWRGKPYG